MTELYFHCSDAEHVLIDECGHAMDLPEARQHAEGLVRALIMTPSDEDWRSWILHVTDELGEELFAMPFASVLGKLH
ncbi:DUF6894 family protein [Bradyrhizobium cenepequi]